MTSYFRDYDLICCSSLFDFEFYAQENPEVDANGMDPISHYLEFGGARRLNPNPGFDAGYYLDQCLAIGEEPSNPLVHYLQKGSELGLRPFRPSPDVDPFSFDKINMDSLSVAPSYLGTVEIRGAGWLVASDTVAEVALELSEEIVGYATYGLVRPDVAAWFPEDLNMEGCGFSFNFFSPLSRLGDQAELTIVARTIEGRKIKESFRLEVPDYFSAVRPSDLDAPEFAAGRGREAQGPSPMRLQIDQVSISDSGIVTVEGWAVSLSPVASVEVLIDGKRLGGAEYGVQRDDVAEAYPDYFEPGVSGFRFVADLGAHAGERCNLVVRCTAKGGVMREVAQPLFIQAPTFRSPSTGPSRVRLQCDEFHLTTDGRLMVEGWAVSLLAIETISILLDNIEIGKAQLGIERPDVGNAFPDIPGARSSGFIFRGVAASDGLAGEFVLTLRVMSVDGEIGDMRLPVAAVAVAALPIAGGLGPGSSNGHLISIDAPLVTDGVATAGVRGSLTINGWAVAENGVAGIDIEIDGFKAVSAYHGMGRPDVAAVFPGREDALLSGFGTVIPGRMIPTGEHRIGIVLKDAQGESSLQEFVIESRQESEEKGPWSLRRAVPYSETLLGLKALAAPGRGRSFCMVLLIGSSDEEIVAARASLASLRAQTYSNWKILISPRIEARSERAWKRRLLQDFDDISANIVFAGKRAAGRSLERLFGADPGLGAVVGVLQGGDELGVDALMEFAVWFASNPDDEFVYCDERRLDPVDGKLDAFFKPDWSPDLLLSTNYIGRMWCAKTSLLAKCGVTLGDLATRGAFDLILRCTECAVGIGHIPQVLCQSGPFAVETPDVERAALEGALTRRGIDGTVAGGCVPHIYQIARRHSVTGLVSIIIPTCAARGLFRVCLESLRRETTYRNFEIVCIENIPDWDTESKAWLNAHADVLLTTAEPFNWSRFNNLAVDAASGDFFVFLNDDIEIISPQWLDVLLSQAERPDVGAAGPLLLYPDRTIQHGGLFLSRSNMARHAFRHGAEDDPGYFGLALTERNVIGVTGACLLTRRETFEALGRFDETHTVINNDLDYCLRLHEAGFRIVYCPSVKLIHHELASRVGLSEDFAVEHFDSRWRDVFLRGDPYFHPRLSKDHDSFSADAEPFRVVCAGRPLIDATQVKRLLILKLDHIGDCITAIPAIARLRSLFPNARVTLLANGSTRSIWSIVPGIDQFIDFAFFHVRSGLGQVELGEEELEVLRQKLAPERFDLAIDLRKSTDTRYLLEYAGAQWTAGFDYVERFPWLDIAVEWEGDPKFKNKRTHISDDLLRLVDAVAQACDADRSVIDRPLPPLPLADALREKIGGRVLVAIHPAAGTPTREWPTLYFAELIDLLASESDIHAIVIGGPDERAYAEKILAAVRHQDRVDSVVGLLQLHQLAELLPHCALFVGNNSGPSHLAAALGVPTVSVHSGVVASEEWGPYGPAAFAIRRDLMCAPCYIAKAEECPRNLACVSRLTPGDVLGLCRRILTLAGPHFSDPYVPA